MIQNRTMLSVADNSGAKSLQMIGLPGVSRQNYAKLGQIVTCVVKKADPNGTVKNAEIVKAVLVRTKKENRRVDGSYIRFDDNAAVVIDNAGNPKGTRIFGPIAREIRERGFMKIVSLAPEVL